MALHISCYCWLMFLERFHHAYWFYLMPSADMFIPLSKYIGPLISVISAVILCSISVWWSTGDIEVVRPNNHEKQKWQFVHRDFGLASFSTRIRPLYMPMLSLALCVVFPGYVFVNFDTIRFIAIQSPISVSWWCSLHLSLPFLHI